MAILKIARMGHPVLRRPADPVADPTAPEIRRLVDDMRETMADAGGIGLAAPQVHVPLRIVIFGVPGDLMMRDRRSDADGPADSERAGVPQTVLINPVIEPLDDEKTLGWEACLSVPGLMGAVPRYRRIRYRGVTPTGAPVERVAESYHARVVQHECDHLDGILYPMRMTDLTLLGFDEEMRRGAPAPEDEEALETGEVHP